MNRISYIDNIKTLGIFFIILGIVLVFIILLFIYCALVLASRADRGEDSSNAKGKK